MNVRRVNPATAVTIIRVLMIFVAIVIIRLAVSKGLVFTAAIIVAMGIVLDALDGKIARLCGCQDEVGKLSDIYADHIVANAMWVTLAVSGLVPLWVPLVTTTRDLVVDWFRQATAIRTGLNAFQQVEISRFRWIVSSRMMRGGYATMKLMAWVGLILSAYLTVSEVGLQVLVVSTVIICIVRALPCIKSGWKHVLVLADR